MRRLRSGLRNGKKGIAFTTGPNAKETHWKQGVMLIDNVKEKAIGRKEGEQLIGELEYSVPEDNSRALKVGMNWNFDGDERNSSQSWNMK